MIGICNSCKTEEVELHKHHIVPRSRGGSDEVNNLVDLCVDCHGKAHDVSFSSKTGLVKGGVTFAKQVSEKSSCWASKENVLEGLLEEVRLKDHLLHDFLVSGMILGLISKDFLFVILHPEFRNRMYSYINFTLDHQTTLNLAYKRVLQ